ncbi:MAG: membrane protein insertase YidC [bacterium]|nr:membrane protein insertase YidC [bacterium]
MFFLLPEPDGPGDTSNTSGSQSQVAGDALNAAKAVDNGTAVDGGASMVAGPAQAEAWSATFELGEIGKKGGYKATFSSLGGVLTELRLSDYFTTNKDELDKTDSKYWVPLVKPVRTATGERGSFGLQPGPSARDLVPYDLEQVHWDREVLHSAGEGSSVVGIRFFHRTPDGLLIEKTIRSVPGEHSLHLELALSGNPGAQRTVGFNLIPALGIPKSSSDQYYQEPRARACGLSGGEWELDSKQVDASGDPASGSFGVGSELVYVGVDNKYFAMLMHAAPGDQQPTNQAALKESSWALIKDLDWADANPEEAAKGAYHHAYAKVGLNLALPAEGQRSTWSYQIYAGPKERSEFEAALPAHAQLLRKDLGFFDGIGTFLLWILNMFHGLVGNWGVSIILLTLTVRFALFPFNRRSQTAMAKHATKMKRVQPRINEIKEKYKKDPRKLREEQTKIMQSEGAFPPLGGCLPPLVQIPIFFGLFSALRVAFDLRQGSFLWVHDLSMPDRLAHINFDTHLPVIGVIEWFNILPILMVVLWVLQQKVMPKPTDPQAAQMQKMMMWMPVVFGVFLYHYAAGLSLYMVTSSLFGIFEYTVVRKIWPLDETEAPKKTKGKLAKRWGTMMEEAQRMQEQKAKSQKAGGSGAKQSQKKGGTKGSGRKGRK